MKKLFFSFGLVLFFVIFPLLFIAYSSYIDESYQNFFNEYRKYQGLINSFETKRSSYQSYNSVSSEFEFLSAGKEMALAEGRAMIEYIKFLKSVLSEVTQVLNYKENYIYVMLDAELSSLSSEVEKVSSISSLTELRSLLLRLKNSYQKIRKFSYQIKFITEVYSLKKIANNLSIEKDNIVNFLNTTASESSQVITAKERIASLNKEIDQLNVDLQNLTVVFDKSMTENNPEKYVEEIRKNADNLLKQMNNIMFKLQDVLNFIY